MKDLKAIIQPRPFYTWQQVTVGLGYLQDHLFGDPLSAQALDLNPIFQRGRVWTTAQQIAFVENLLRRPQSVNSTIFFNDGWLFNDLKKDEHNDMIAGKRVCLDGLQRLTALLDFMDGKFLCFDNQVGWADILKAPNKRRLIEDSHLTICDLQLNTNEEVLNFYLDFNAGGTPHSPEEIERVKMLLIKNNKKV